jgi:hypothetical protein
MPCGLLIAKCGLEMEKQAQLSLYKSPIHIYYSAIFNELLSLSHFSAYC